MSVIQNKFQINLFNENNRPTKAFCLIIVASTIEHLQPKLILMQLKKTNVFKYVKYYIYSPMLNVLECGYVDNDLRPYIPIDYPASETEVEG